MSDVLLAEAKKALDRAKISMMHAKNSAFWTTILLSVKHIFDDKVQTLETDGLNIWFNPRFFLEELSIGARHSALVHETKHIAYQHMLRGLNLDQEKFNIACDHVINLQNKAEGLEVPDTWYCDDQFKGLGAEQVYKLLPDPPPSQKIPKGALGPDLKAPGPADGNAPGGKSAEKIKAEIDDILIRASIQSKLQGDKPGTIPGEIELYIESLLNPLLPWNRILHKHMNQFAKEDYSFKKPSRRFFPDHVLPSLHSERLVNVAMGLDISCSVTDHQFKQSVSESYDIVKRFRPQSFTLVQFDTRIQSVDKLRTANDFIKLKFQGRGGTQIGPLLEWAVENKPPLLLIFTDGEFQQRNIDPGIPVIWIIHNNLKFTAPFGKVIHYQLPRS